MNRIEWRVIPSNPNYEVSSEGHIRRRAGGPGAQAGRMLHPTLDANGYVRVGLSQNGVREFRWVHAIVAEAFIGPRPPGHQVNHIDGRKPHNSVANLEYVTVVENHRHASRTGLKASGARNGRARLTAEQVREIRRLRSDGGTLAEIAARFDVSDVTVSLISRGRTWKCVA